MSGKTKYSVAYISWSEYNNEILREAHSRAILSSAASWVWDVNIISSILEEFDPIDYWMRSLITILSRDTNLPEPSKIIQTPTYIRIYFDDIGGQTYMLTIYSRNTGTLFMSRSDGEGYDAEIGNRNDIIVTINRFLES